MRALYSTSLEVLFACKGARASGQPGAKTARQQGPIAARCVHACEQSGSRDLKQVTSSSPGSMYAQASEAVTATKANAKDDVPTDSERFGGDTFIPDPFKKITSWRTQFANGVPGR